MGINFSLRREVLLGLQDMEIKMEEIKQKKKRYWLIGGIIGLISWAILSLIFYTTGLFFDCGATNYLGEGYTCWNIVQHLVLGIFAILSFPFLFIGANPNLSTVGPSGVRLFWVGSAISLTLWGILISYIYQKIKEKKTK